jgi:ankyrin repeat protein
MKNSSYGRLTLVLVAALICGISKVQAQQETQQGNMEQEFLTAVIKGEGEKVSELLKKNPALARTTDHNGVSSVLLAQYRGRKNIVDMLVASGLELDIFEAAATGQADRVRRLLSKDQSLSNAFAPDGFTPLGLAAFFGSKEVVEVLLDDGANPDLQSKNAFKAVPLQSAAVRGRLEIARLLVNHGAKTNVRGEGGYTPLHEVASNGQIEFAKLLLEYNADINAKGDDGKTPLAIALASKQDEMTKFLRTRGAQ